MADESSVASELLGRLNLGHPTKMTRKQFGALRRTGAERSHDRRDKCEVTRVSTRTEEIAPTMSAHDGDVAAHRNDHRSARYQDRADAAGAEVRAARKRAGWTQQQLAEVSGVERSQISRLENGVHVEISVGRFFDICEALRLDPVYVWTGHMRGRSIPAPPIVPNLGQEAPPRHASEPPPASVKRASNRPKRR